MADPYAPLLRATGVSVISTDVFDTVLLRDGTTETQRFALAADGAARRLGVDPRGLRHLRWYAQEAAFKAVAMTDPAGEASLASICTVIARTLGLPDSAADVLREEEVHLDSQHLRANDRLVDVLLRARAGGVRIIAVSDTIYSAADLRELFAALLPDGLFDEVYTSADLGRTKHDGGIFAVVSEREGVQPGAVLHVGDHPLSDLRNATRAGWRAVHAPRGAAHLVQRVAGAIPAQAHRRARYR